MTTKGQRRTTPRSTAARKAVAQDAHAQEELAQIIRESGPLQQLLEELEQYPAALFRRVCALGSARGGPVPDYDLGLVPYLGEVSLRALEQAQLIERVDRQSIAMHAYVPTAKGKALWERLQAQLASPSPQDQAG